MPGHCTDPLDSSSSIPIGFGYSRTKMVIFHLKNNLPIIYKKRSAFCNFFLLQNTLLFSLLFLFGESMNVYFHNRFVTLFSYSVLPVSHYLQP